MLKRIVRILIIVIFVPLFVVGTIGGVILHTVRGGYILGKLVVRDLMRELF